MAERVGFEPTVGGDPTHDFQSCAFDRSAISPQIGRYYGGEGGIRTPGDREATTVFETAPIDHSGTSPHLISSRSQRREKTPEQIGAFLLEHSSQQLTTVVQTKVVDQIA